MKKALSIVLSVAMLMTCIFTMFVTPAAADEGIIELMNLGYVAEGMENITLNDDGSWTITGKVGMAVNLEYDITTVKNIYQHLDATTPVKITLYDGYADKWIGLYDNWVGPQFFPAGVYQANNGVDGIYNWNGFATQGGVATLTAIYIEFEDEAAANSVTLYQLYLNDGTLKPADVALFPENKWEDLMDNWNQFVPLASDNAAEWIPCSPDTAGGANIIISEDEYGSVQLGSDAAGWPSASLEVNKTVDYYTSALDIDLSVLSGASTTLYVFFGDATPDDFEGEGKAYGTILADVTYGNYYGTVMLSDILPEDSDVIDENGMVTVSYIKLFSISDAAMDPGVQVHYMDLCYYADNPLAEGILGDADGDGDVDTYDALLAFNTAAGVLDVSDGIYDRADYDRDFVVTINDALLILCEAAGCGLGDLSTAWI